MKKNSFPFILDEHLIADVECLCNFIKPTSINKFLKKFPRNILNTKLEELEFDSQGSGSIECFIIKFKDVDKKEKIELTNKLLSALGITITDHAQLVDRLKNNFFLFPESQLKTALNNIIQENIKNNQVLTINSTIEILQEKTLDLSGNNDKKIEIELFFNFLKVLISREISFNSPSSAKSFLTSAAHLTNECMSEINILISAVNEYINLPKNITKAVFSYSKLLDKVAFFLSFPQSKTIINDLDSIIESHLDKENYSFFKQCYLGKPGFRSIFLADDKDLYGLIQTGCKKLNSFKHQYVEITHLIDELSSHSDGIPEVIKLAAILNEQTNIYFQSLLDISLRKREDIDVLEIKAFNDFKFNIKNRIAYFQRNNPNCLYQIKDILNKILNAVAKIIPSFIISREQRITFFKKHTSHNKQFAKLQETIDSIKPTGK